MKKITLLAICTAVIFTVGAQTHKATKAEAEYSNKSLILFSAMPEKFLQRDLDDFGAPPEKMNEGDNTFDCKKLADCFLGANCGYGPPMNDPGYVSMRKEQEAIRGNDDASEKKKKALMYKEYSQYHLTVKAMANFISGENIYYCQPGGYQKLTPPAGWDGWYLGSSESCIGSGDPDQSFIFMGSAPEVKETKGDSGYHGVPTFPINPADVSQYKVKNIVLYIEGSKELIADFMKNVNTASLRAMIQN